MTPRGTPAATDETRQQRARAVAHLRQADPVIARLVDADPDFDPRAWLRELPEMDLRSAR